MSTHNPPKIDGEEKCTTATTSNFMDILESVLQTCHAEEFVYNFRDNGIDIFTLKILTEEDLKILGIKDAKKREQILQYVSKMQIPSEKKVNIVIDRQYAFLALNVMSMQLNKHYAILTYMLKRRNVKLCDIKLPPAVDCLQDCFNSLEDKLTELEAKIFVKQKKKNTKFLILFPTLAVTSLILFACSKYFGCLNK